MERNQEERIIYFRDLVFSALRKWKTVLALTLIMTVLLGGYKLIYEKVHSDPLPSGDVVEEYRERKLSLEERITVLQKQLDGQNTYLANSLLMRLNPYNHFEARLSVCVTAQNGADQGELAVLQAYKKALLGEQSIQKIAQLLELEPVYVSELIFVELDEAAKTLWVRAKCDTQEAAEGVLEALAETVDGSDVQAVLRHTASYLEKTVTPCVDNALAQTQRDVTTTRADVQNLLTEAKRENNTLPSPSASDSGSLRNILTFAITGGLLTFAGCVVLLWVLYIAGTKVYSRRTLQDATGVGILGCVAVTQYKNKLDRRIQALEGRAQTQAYTRAVADIRCRLNGEKVLLTGDGDAGALAQALREEMPQLQILNCGDILTRAEAVEALNQCDTVILVERCRVSRYENVRCRMALAQEYEKTLLGCVLLDG